MRTLTLALSCLFILTSLCAGLAFGQANVQSMALVRVKLPSGEFARTDSVSSGGTVRFTGFPFPLQYLNNGELHFLDSSLTERVTITIEVPSFARISENSISFGDSMASAVRFLVTRGDTPMSPYRFSRPVELTLPIPPNIPPTIGSQVRNLVLSFRDSSGRFDTSGIRTTIHDSVLKIVRAEVGHFTDVVMTSAKFLGTVTSVTGQPELIPGAYTLYQNYPNPFNPSTVIRFSIPNAGHVTLKVYNVIGQEIATLVNDERSAGQHEVRWDASGLPSGVYFYRLQVGAFSEVRKIVLLR